MLTRTFPSTARISRKACSDSGQVRQAEGDLAGASADWRRAVELFKSVSGLDGEYVFYWAACHASLSNLAGVAGTGVAGGEKDAHCERSLDLLRQAAAMGYRNPGVFRTETAARRARRRDDFRLMVLDLEMPRDPFGRVLQ